jgi:hypothetical protein
MKNYQKVRAKLEQSLNVITASAAGHRETVGFVHTNPYPAFQFASNCYLNANKKCSATWLK